MNAILPADIVVELESAIAGCPPDRCVRMLWRTTDLLVAGRDRLREQEISVLDEVLIRLCEHIEPRALAKLSAALAELRAAPKETLRRLVLDDDPTIAVPLLQKSEAITARDLETIAATRGEQHLLAIAGRRKVAQSVSDLLLRRGSKTVWRALARNPGAQLSEAGCAALLAKAKGDDELTKALAARPDMPASRTAARAVTDYSEAASEIAALSRIGKLNDSTVNRFAIRGERASLITSLSVLSGAPIEIVERVMADDGYEGLVMACRASRLTWQTTLAILGNRGGPQFSAADRVRAQDLFETQHLSTSQWTVRWGAVAAGAASGNGPVAQSGGKR